MTDPRPTALSSNPGQVEPGLFSEHELREQWNAQADEFNQWESLDSSEQLAWAQTRAIAAQPADHAKGPSLADVAELCAEFSFHHEDGDSLEILQEMITAAVTRWRAPVAKPVATPALAPRIEHILRLAEIVREVTGSLNVGDILGSVLGRDQSVKALAEAILSHPGFSGCHDALAALQAPGFQIGPQEYIPHA